MKQTILVTGANGQLGRCIRESASRDEQYRFIFASSKELDISNNKDVTSYFTKHKIHWCINCAAYTAVDAAENAIKTAEKVNVVGVENLVEVCKNQDILLVHISTDFVFDGSKNEPYNEHDITNPLSVYGKTKLKGEQAIIKGLTKYYIVRTSWLYSEFGTNFLKTMLRLSIDRKELKVVSDQIGTPTYAGDLAEILLQIMNNDIEYGVYHFSNEGIASWYDFAVEIFKSTQKDVKVLPIQSEAYPTTAIRPKYSVLDTTKIKTRLNCIIPNWRESLNKCLQLLE